MVAARTLGRAGLGARLTDVLCESFADCHWQRRYRFFHGVTPFAADSDCTGVALAALFQAGKIGKRELFQGATQLCAAVPNEVAPESRLRRDVVLVYWDDDREPGVARRGFKQDPVVAANATYALLLALEAGFAHPRVKRVVAANLAYVRESLVTERARTRYYPSRDALLFFAGELCRRYPLGRAALAVALRRAVLAQVTVAPCAPIDLAMRASALSAVGLDATPLTRRLLELQDASGAWPAGPFFTLGRLAGLSFGSTALTTALALGALAPMGSLREVAA